LAAQHLTGLQLVTEISGGSLIGGEINSVRVQYQPPPEASDGVYVIRSEYSVDIGTAGSICLLIQTSLPVLTFAPHRIITMLKGGTNVDFSPQVEYVQHILGPHLKRLCV
jgi:RNA 3'-terminal phosphate cyclase (ATP)